MHRNGFARRLRRLHSSTTNRLRRLLRYRGKHATLLERWNAGAKRRAPHRRIIGRPDPRGSDNGDRLCGGVCIIGGIVDFRCCHQDNRRYESQLDRRHPDSGREPQIAQGLLGPARRQHGRQLRAVGLRPLHHLQWLDEPRRARFHGREHSEWKQRARINTGHDERNGFGNSHQRHGSSVSSASTTTRTGPFRTSTGTRSSGLTGRRASFS